MMRTAISPRFAIRMRLLATGRAGSRYSSPTGRESILALTEAALRSALERIGSDAPVRFDEVTGSTQVAALELAEAGAPEWTLVAAGHQTQGRGRLERPWLDA